MESWERDRQDRIEREKLEAVKNLKAGDSVWLTSSKSWFEHRTGKVLRLTQTLIVLEGGGKFKRTGVCIGQVHGKGGYGREYIEALTDQKEKHDRAVARHEARMRIVSKLEKIQERIDRGGRTRDPLDEIETSLNAICAKLGIEVES